MTAEERKDEDEEEDRQQGDNDEENPAETPTNEPASKVEAKKVEETTQPEEDSKPAAAKTKRNSSGRQSSTRSLEFPKSFYDPLTLKVMMDPVVAPNGLSYEQKDALERSPNATYYQNRALKAYIEHEVERARNAGSMRGKLLQINESLRTGFQKLLEQSAIPSPEFKALPGTYTVCLVDDDDVRIGVCWCYSSSQVWYFWVASSSVFYFTTFKSSDMMTKTTPNKHLQQK